jgi:excisionase family DNA binding protein
LILIENGKNLRSLGRYEIRYLRRGSLDIPARLERRRKALTVAELADELNLSGKTIYEQVSKGHIPYYKIAGSIRFDPVRIAGWLRLQEAA